MTPLAEEAILFVFAQIAVLFAGFGGVSIVLGRLRSPIERARLRNVIMTALMLLLFSIFPLVVHQFGLEPHTTWRIATAVLATVMIVFYVVSGDLKLLKESHRVDQVLIAGDAVLILFLIAGTFMSAAGLASKLYLVALFWHLLSACIMFLLVFAPVWQDEEMGND